VSKQRCEDLGPWREGGSRVGKCHKKLRLAAQESDEAVAGGQSKLMKDALDAVDEVG